MEKNNGLIFTSGDCIGCNKCIKGCPVIGSNLAIEENGVEHIIVDGAKCIHCGQCLKNCEHGARHFRDDIDKLFSDVQCGTKIDLLIAPSFFLIYGDEAKKYIGYLRELGFAHIYDVSAGANITTWAYASYLKETGKKGLISSPCPAVVDYIQKYKPELISYLMPIMSPVSAFRTYLEKKYPDRDRKFAFLCPCIGKHDEKSTNYGGSSLDYTFTFSSFIDYITSRCIFIDIYSGKCDELLDFGLGRFYPVPGGLKENLKYFYETDDYIKQLEGPSKVYKFLDSYASFLRDPNSELPLMIDILNCEGGCVEGVASSIRTFDCDSHIIDMNKASKDPDVMVPGSSFDTSLSAGLRFDKFRRLMQKDGFTYTNFMRIYDTHIAPHEERVSPDVIEEAFNRMHKHTNASRTINCTSCGYSSCHDMAVAISHGYNRPENCVHFMKGTLEQERMDLSALLSQVCKSEVNVNPEKMGIEYIIHLLSTAINDIETTRESVLNESRAKSQFFASMTHELRTPLNAILNMADVLKGNLPKGQSTEEIDSIKSAGEALLDTVNELLDMSKFEAGKFSLVEEEYDLQSLINDVSNIINFRAIEKKLDFNVIPDSTLPQKVIGDEKRIRQILINICGNAVKYTPKGAVNLSISWNNDTENPVLSFSVKDTGIGIKEEDIPFLFSAYKQVDEAKNHNIEGTGLGLSIVKALSDEMNGTINVTSEYGIGSCFEINLPQRIDKYEPLGFSNKFGRSENSTSKFIAMPQALVLITDDTAVNQTVAVSFLERLQCGILLASSGAEAIDLCNKFSFDIILMDYQMPGLNGLDSLKEIRREGLNKDTTALILSADDYIEGDSSLYAKRLDKPLKHDELEKALLKYIPDEKIEKYDKVSLPAPKTLTKCFNANDMNEYLNAACEIERYARVVGNLPLLGESKHARLSIQTGMLEQITSDSTASLESLLEEARKEVS